MPVSPPRLKRIATDEFPSNQFEAGLAVTNVRSSDVPEHIRFAATDSAGAGTPQPFQEEIRFFAIIPLYRQFPSDQLNVRWFKTHGSQ
jgi:hypothetical protein